jgi:hypothetical protein
MGNFCRFIPMTQLISALIRVSTLYMDSILPKLCTNSHYFNTGDLVLAKIFGGQFFFFRLEPWTYLPASCFGTLFRHPLGEVSSGLDKVVRSVCVEEEKVVVIVEWPIFW